MHLRPSSLLALLALLPLAHPALGQAPPEHGKRYGRLLIRNVYVIDGNGTPTIGPTNVVVAHDRIARVGGPARPKDFDAVIDGRGRYLIPGLINLHGHLQDERAGIAMPFQLQLDLWLASGITTIRDVGCDRGKGLELRARSAAGEVIAPRIFLYMVCRAETAEQAVAAVDEVQELGADGIKITGMDREPLEALLARAAELGLPVAHHVGVEETDVWDDIRGGTRSIEHWYGIPDAAIPYGSQSFPAEYNYANELDRFRWAGRLWKDADPERLSRVLQSMVDAGVAWDPTLTIYVASRDVTRAQNQPWFEDYLHPALEEFFRPDQGHHGSYFLGWTTQDEIEWRHNYQIWFRALREFAERGGIIGTGEDAGFIYQIYGFGYVRELELQQEAGFHPLDVLRHATGNGASILGMEHELGRIKAGYKADLALVNGNPLANFKLLYPTGAGVVEDGEFRHGGTVAWTIKDGYCYQGALLSQDARRIVAEARKKRPVAREASVPTPEGALRELPRGEPPPKKPKGPTFTVVTFLAGDLRDGSEETVQLTEEPVPRPDGYDPKAVDVGDLPRFDPTPETTAVEWEELIRAAQLIANPLKNIGVPRARRTLVKGGRRAWPAVLNELKRLDLSEPGRAERADILRGVLQETANGRTVEWRESGTAEDLMVNRKAVKMLCEVWLRCIEDDSYWRWWAQLGELRAGDPDDLVRIVNEAKTLGDIPDFEPLAETTPGEWKELTSLVAAVTKAESSQLSARALKRLIEFDKKAWPAVINGLKDLDLGSQEGAQAAEQLQNVLKIIANGRSVGWNRDLDEKGTAFRKRSVHMLCKVWARATVDERYWRNYAKLDGD